MAEREDEVENVATVVLAERQIVREEARAWRDREAGRGRVRASIVKDLVEAILDVVITIMSIIAEPVAD